MALRHSVYYFCSGWKWHFQKCYLLWIAMDFFVNLFGFLWEKGYGICNNPKKDEIVGCILI